MSLFVFSARIYDLLSCRLYPSLFWCCNFDYSTSPQLCMISSYLVIVLQSLKGKILGKAERARLRRVCLQC